MPRQTLKQRKDGYFRCKYHGVQFYGKTRKEATQKRDAYITQMGMGLDPDKAKVTFYDYGMNWLSLYRNTCGTAQQKQYAAFIQYVAEALQPKTLLREITADDLQALCNEMSVYSQSYINKLMNTLRAIFAAAYTGGAILRNPMEGVKKVQGQKCEGHRALHDWERSLILRNYADHDFGPAAMVMMYAGLRRGEVLYLDVDRDVDFEKKTLTVRGAVSFSEGNQPTVTDGKTENAQRVIPLVKPLELALRGRHGLLCRNRKGGLMSESSFDRKYESFIAFLETRLNGCHKRWYGKTRAHKAILAEGKELPPWQDIDLRCHDFRVDFCTRNYAAKVPLKTLQSWMGHSDVLLILRTYTKFDHKKELEDAATLTAFMDGDVAEMNTEGIA